MTRLACPQCGHAGIREQSCPRCLHEHGAFITMRPRRPQASRTDAPVSVHRLDAPAVRRLITPWSDVDALLNGGVAVDSTLLLAGRPGSGKSTFALQFAAGFKALYVSGEEPEAQIRARYERVCPRSRAIGDLDIWEQPDLHAVCRVLAGYHLAVIDSLQVLNVQGRAGVPGGPVQMRAALIALTKYAHDRRVTILILSHVNQKGQPAGSMFHQHLVDCVLLFRGQPEEETRELVIQKHRFGPSGQALPMRMTATGLEVVTA